MKISEVSEFSVLPYVQNRKLGNLEKFSFTSNFDISCNLRFKNEKKRTFRKIQRIFCHNLALNLQCTIFFI